MQDSEASLPEITSREIERDGYRILVEKENFGHGDVDVVQVIPPELQNASPDELKKARKQFYVSGHSPSGKNDLPVLQDDLLALNKGREEGEPVISVGISFSGVRVNSSRLVDDFPPGVKVTRLQSEKAQDMVSVASGMIDGKNAELIGFSAGGPIVQIALELGLQADTVGLFNAGGLDDKGSYRTHSRVILEQASALLRKKDGSGLKIEKPDKSLHPDRSLWDRFRRARKEQTSAGKGKTHLLPGMHPDTLHVVGDSEKDRTYPRRRIKKVLRKTGAENITFVELDWIGHGLSTDPIIRGERLGTMSRAMQKAKA
jgi:hypothetical protein